MLLGKVLPIVSAAPRKSPSIKTSPPSSQIPPSGFSTPSTKDEFGSLLATGPSTEASPDTSYASPHTSASPDTSIGSPISRQTYASMTPDENESKRSGQSSIPSVKDLVVIDLDEVPVPEAPDVHVESEESVKPEEPEEAAKSEESVKEEEPPKQVEPQKEESTAEEGSVSIESEEAVDSIAANDSLTTKKSQETLPSQVSQVTGAGSAASSPSADEDEEDEEKEVESKPEDGSNMTDKELFDKLLESYEKEDEMVERISQDDEFFESQLALVKSKESVEQFMAEDDAADKKDEPAEKTKKKSKRGFFKRKSSLTEIIAPRDEELQRSDSVDQTSVIEGADARVEENIQHEIEEDIKEMKQKEEPAKEVQFSKGSTLFEKERGSFDEKQIITTPSPVDSTTVSESSRPFRQKETEREVRHSSNVHAREIGKCFRRGFRPDNLALSGEPCLDVDLKEQMKRVDPDAVDERGSIIDFSERETPLEYLLGLGFSVDEASNAIKDEDVRNRLNAAITEVRKYRVVLK